MILDPLYPAMSIANAAAVAVRPLLWIRQNARRIRHQWASKPAETFGPANGSGKEKCNRRESIPDFADFKILWIQPNAPVKSGLSAVNVAS
jgi:hypothetical protein